MSEEVKPINIQSGEQPAVESLVKEVPEVNNSGKGKMKFIITTILVILSGVGTGYLLSSKVGGGSGLVNKELGGAAITKGTEIGIEDEKTFKGSAEGDLEKGGINDEGSHHLVRPGGDSQNVYLTSSAIDLDQFVGRKVKVWGETFSAKSAGWLMDVGKLKVLE